MRKLTQLPRLPTEILGIRGEPLELLLWNIAIMQSDEDVGRVPDYDPRQLNKRIDSMKFGSVAERIRYKRKLMGIG